MDEEINNYSEKNELINLEKRLCVKGNKIKKTIEKNINEYKIAKKEALFRNEKIVETNKKQLQIIEEKLKDNPNSYNLAKDQTGCQNRIENLNFIFDLLEIFLNQIERELEI